MQDKPLIGTGVLIFKDGKILLGKRLSNAGKGTWCPPGGKLEMNELVQDCARREAKEETGVTVGNLKFITFTDEIEREVGKHFVTLHFESEWVSGEPTPEPDKFEEWRWFDWDTLPDPLFLPFANLIKSGYKPNIV